MRVRLDEAKLKQVADITRGQYFRAGSARDLQQVYKIPYDKAFGRGGLVELLAGRKGVSGRYVATMEKPDAATVRIHLPTATAHA